MNFCQVNFFPKQQIRWDTTHSMALDIYFTVPGTVPNRYSENSFASCQLSVIIQKPCFVQLHSYLYYACVALCNQINLFADTYICIIFFSVQIWLFMSSSQSKKVSINVHSQGFLRLLGNRLVVVHLVLELQHENHVTFNSF